MPTRRGKSLTPGSSQGKQPRMRKGDTSRAARKLVQGGKYVSDFTLNKIIRLIERIGFPHNDTTGLQGGNGSDEYYHNTAAEQTEVTRAVPGTIVTETDNAADTLPLELGTKAIGSSTKFMRQDAVISDILPATTTMLDGAAAVTQADGDGSTKVATTEYADGKVEDSISDSETSKAPSQNAVFDALALKAPIDSPTFTTAADAPTPGIDTNDTSIATTAHVYAKILQQIAALDLYQFQGTLDCSANPNYPAADAGYIWIVPTGGAGKIGGASGPVVEPGDTLFCFVDSSASGDHATVGANWIIGQANLQPELYALLAGAAFTGDVSITGASLDMTGTDNHFAAPSLTTAERDALSPSEGWLIFNETDSQYQQYANGAWGAIGGGDALVVSKASHGWVDADIGTKVYKGTGAGVYEVADRDSAAAAESFWYLSRVFSTSLFELKPIGLLTRTTAQWDALLGTTGGPAENDLYYLAANGASYPLTTDTPGDGEFDKPVCVAISATEMWYFDYRGAEISDSYGKHVTVTWANLAGGSTYDVVHGLGVTNVHVMSRDSDGNQVQVDNVPKAGALDTTVTMDYGAMVEADFPVTHSFLAVGASTKLNIDNINDPEPIGTADPGDDNENAAPRNHVHESSIANQQDYVPPTTWTPAISGITFSVSTCVYSKFGKLGFISLFFTGFSGSPGTEYTITGFTELTPADRCSLNAIHYDNSDSYAPKNATARIEVNGDISVETQGFTLAASDRVLISGIFFMA